MPYLIDSNVVSETRKPKRDSNVMEWLESTPNEELRLSVMVIGEARLGVERVRRRDPLQATHLEVWVSGLYRRFSGRIVPITVDVAEVWGQLNCPDPLPFTDGIMAATAITHGWTMVTRNVADFERTGVALLNPFEPTAST